MSDPVIRVENLDVRYLVHPYRQKTLYAMITSLGHGEEAIEIRALSDVSFSVSPGEVLGAIGPNGSGKTTLLKTLAGIVPPSAGIVDVTGRVGSLIELGGGFNPELTGTENIWLQCSLLGLNRRQITARFDSIVEFSGLAQVIDIPVKNYSAGMYMRLGFAIAAQAEADVLLIDEILSVGDLEFQQKSYDRILELIAAGRGGVIVSHDLNAIATLCDRAMVLDEGKVVHLGAVEAALDCYHELSQDKLSDDDVRSPVTASVYQGQPAISLPGFEPEGSGKAHVSKVVFLDATREETTTVVSGQPLTVRIEYRASEEVNNPVFGLAVFTEDLVHVSGPNTLLGGRRLETLKSSGAIEYEIPSFTLMPGTYLLIASIFEQDLVTPIDHSRRFYRLTVTHGNDRGIGGLIDLAGSWSHRTE